MEGVPCLLQWLIQDQCAVSYVIAFIEEVVVYSMATFKFQEAGKKL